MLHRLLQFAVGRARDDFGLADHQLITLAPHHFDQDGKLQLAPAEHFEGVGVIHFLDSDGDVGQKLLVQPLAQVARSDVGSIAAGEG